MRRGEGKIAFTYIEGEQAIGVYVLGTTNGLWGTQQVLWVNDLVASNGETTKSP